MAKSSGLIVFDYLAYRRDLKYLMRGYSMLPPSLSKKHIKAAMTRAFKPFEKDFRAGAPVYSGRLRRSVGTKTYFENRGNYNWVTKVGYMRKAGKLDKGTGKRKGGKQGAHAILVNYGTKQRSTKSGANRGSVAAQNFFRSIMASVATRARPMIETHLGAALEKAVKEMEKRIQKGIPLK